jgi:cation diffusion facilitator CzcD-associated flavoprotein CzcO
MTVEEQRAAARRDLVRLNFPPATWVPPRTDADGTRVLDVLVVGGGMTGQTVAFALLAEGIDNIRVIDQAARGHEGPWATFARMDILRSPKHINGPDLGVASLTFRAWYEAHHGADGWEALGKIARLEWADYLLWVRDTVGIRVENRTTLTSLTEVDGRWRAEVETGAGTDTDATTITSRKVVLALGRNPTNPHCPDFPSYSRRKGDRAEHPRVLHSSDPLDPSSLSGERLAVLGAGASAFDTAATALEAGARSVTIHARRAALPQRNLFRPFAWRHVARGFGRLDEIDRWRLFNQIFDAQVPPPHESVLRCDAHPNFALRLGSIWLDIEADANGVSITTNEGIERVERVILATGFTGTPLQRPAFETFGDDVLTWADRVGAEEATAHPVVAGFPLVGAAFELRPRPGVSNPLLADVHLADWTAQPSVGAQGGDIPGLDLGARQIAAAVAGDLYLADAAHHAAAIRGYPEMELESTRWFVPGG